jgi:hypothetical protein
MLITNVAAAVAELMLDSVRRHAESEPAGGGDGGGVR